MHLIHGDKVTAPEAARVLGKSHATIRQYGSRGVLLEDGTRFYLWPTGLDNRGCNLYSLADIRTVAKAVRERGRSHKPVLAVAA